MEKLPLISIIVPVYKVEAYLDKCIDSIVRQTYSNLQIILVDDGSPDNCGAMCDAWAEKDSRIQVIHKKNGGLSDARNAGMAAATGKYIAFVDSDDWVEPLYVQRLLEGMLSCGGDICECEVLRTDGTVSIEAHPEAKAEIWQAVPALEQLIHDGVFHQYVWNKLYRRSVIGDIRFPVGKTNEDEFWTYQVFGRAKCVVKISDVLYNYLQRPGSIMSAGYSLRRLHALEAKAQRQVYLEVHFSQLAPAAKANLYFSCVYAAQMSLLHLAGEERKEAKRIIDHCRQGIRLDKEMVSTLNAKARLWLGLCVISFWGTCRFRNFLKRGL